MVIPASIGKTKLDSGWLAARSTDVNVSGIQLTTTSPPTGAASPWMIASVPGTVLGTLLKNNLIPDPFYGLQNEAIIDIAVSGREHYTFWFFTSFQCNMSENQHLDLNFRGLNYSADLYINGHEKKIPKGMFRRHCFDISDVVNFEGQNFLAALVYPPDNPGAIPSEGGQGGDHEIGKDVATQYVEGWDWMTPIRDRNTGIWDEVSLCVTGPIKIIDPHLVSTFFDDYKRVYLHATVELENKSSFPSDSSITIEVTSDVEDDICLVEHLSTQHLIIPPKKRVQFTFPEMFFYKPKLWWPNGMGRQSLYNVTITVHVNSFGESDAWSHLFGFRKIVTDIDPSTNGRVFKVNGQPVFIRGGNWIVSDGLLRLSKNRYETEMKFHRDMNLNMIRCWGGGIAERPEFYHFCDLYGLLVWQEFWITGDMDGRGDPVSNPNGPLDHDLFLLCARDTVKLLRNHASLAIWVGGNEQTPPHDINEALKNDLRLYPHFVNDFSEFLDGTRAYVQGSMWDGFADGKGNFTDGPYDIQEPERFFEDGFYGFGFNPEVGSVGMPVASTIRAAFPPEGWEIPIFKKCSDGFIEEIPNPIWTYHKYIPYSKRGKAHDQIASYGLPKDLDDFCLKAQLANYVQYKALVEGWSSKMWSKFTGFLVWKTQNPWTGLRGQFYDHFLDQTAGFYGCRAAAEAVHVQLNLASYFIEVVNTLPEEISGVGIEVSVYDLDGNCPEYKTHENLTVPPQKVLQVVEIEYPKARNPKPVFFLLLKLYKTSNFEILSRNFYWLHPRGGDYSVLENYRKKKVPLKITSEVSRSGVEYEVVMRVRNMSKMAPERSELLCNNVQGRKTDDVEGSDWEGRRICKQGVCHVVNVNGENDGVAFFVHFSVSGEGKKILPVHYSDNYISPVPGETMTVRMSFSVPPRVTPRVAIHGWNYNHAHSFLSG